MLIIIVFILLTVLIIMYMSCKTYENFISHSYLDTGITSEDDLLLTANPVHLVPSSCIDDSIRHVKINKSGNIEYVSSNPPQESCCYQISCPDFVNVLTTLGKNNICWQC